MTRDFNTWLSSFRESIANYTYYIDFSSVHANVSSVKSELEKLNVLIGSNDIENDFKNLCKCNHDVIRTIPLLLAKREKTIFCSDTKGSFNYDFDSAIVSEEYLNQLSYFMKETGLFELFSNHLINNVVDYATGVEAGLNSNGRKNRGGHLMEDLVESYINKAGFVKNKDYFKEMYLSDLEKITNLDLSSLSNKGETAKRFDFVIIGKGCVYACECNFYASGGSKLNETARSYKTLALESKGIKGFKFVWFTDGLGWVSARNNLKETFDVLDTLYNICELEEGVLNNF